MTDTKTGTTGLNQFNTYLETHQSYAKSEKVSDLYYHVNVVAEAYDQGLSDGKNIGRQEFVEKIMKTSAERFTEKANNVYILSKRILHFLGDNGYTVDSFHINIFHKNPKVIFAVKNSILLEDKFIELAYTKIHEVKCTFRKTFESTLDMGLIDSDSLDLDLLSQDGFEYSEGISYE